MDKVLFTSESVTEGHPDKICDQISDAILDALLEQDPMSRVACETCTTTGIVMVMGEISTKAYVDIQKIVRDTVREIGYTRGKYGFDADTCGVITTIDEQSSDIAMGVDKALEAKENNMTDEEIDAIGAGDQPPTAVLPPVAAATTPVIVSLDCAFTFREPAWMDVSSNTSALVWLLKMMLAPAPPTATAPPDTDAAPEVMYCQLMAFTLTAAVPASIVPPSWLVTVFSV